MPCKIEVKWTVEYVNTYERVFEIPEDATAEQIEAWREALCGSTYAITDDLCDSEEDAYNVGGWCSERDIAEITLIGDLPTAPGEQMTLDEALAS